MARRTGRSGWRVMTGVVLAASQAGVPAVAQAPAAGVPAVALPSPMSAESILQFGPAQLDALYRAAGPGSPPRGRVRGIPIVSPGSNMAAASSKAARLVWQGKVFNDDSTAVNRFFGVRAVRGRVYYAPSWVDGRTSLVLDYQGTSLVYARYRDEIREIAPGLYLGVMYARTEPTPTFTRYFAFEAR